MSNKPPIIPREKLNFGLDGDIPKYWFGGHPFKTRFFDAMSSIFPEGEKFFIACVRDYRDQVTDPQLKQDIKDFIRQEAQHTLVHNQFNQHLKAQGIDVDRLEAIQHYISFDLARKYAPKAATLSATAAAEHMTAIMAHSFFERKEVLEQADPRMRALYAWHAMEEIEHKAVAFDVMQKVAKVGYFRRAFGMVQVTLAFTIHVLLVTRFMLKVDGFSAWERTKLWAQGLWWLYKPGGLFLSITGHYLAYFKPGFHPWKAGELHSYQTWVDVFNQTGDPLLAGQALHAAGH
jgi:predicted metal-dependent hydrolase